jgi:hypothetical protein
MRYTNTVFGQHIYEFKRGGEILIALEFIAIWHIQSHKVNGIYIRALYSIR